MEKMKEELYKELHITKEVDKAIISGLIGKYSAYRNDYSEVKAIVKASYKTFKLNMTIELFNTHRQTIFINGMLIFNSDTDLYNREINCTCDGTLIDCWVNDVLVFSIKTKLIRTIETQNTTLYREDETLLW